MERKIEANRTSSRSILWVLRNVTSPTEMGTICHLDEQLCRKFSSGILPPFEIEKPSFLKTSETLVQLEAKCSSRHILQLDSLKIVSK